MTASAPRRAMKKTAILFVCSQNRCRSLAAEGVFRYIAQASQVSWSVDSAGLAAQAGRRAEEPISHVAALRGYNFGALRSRPLAPDDFYRFDYIVAADKNTQAALLRRAPRPCPSQISLLMAYSVFFNDESELDYPCSGDTNAFAAMLDRIEDACLGLFHFVKKRRGEDAGEVAAESA